MSLKKLSYYALFFALAVVVACGGKEETSAPAPPAAPKAPTAAATSNAFDASKATATISGAAMLEGTAAEGAKLPMTPECLQEHGGKASHEESVVANEAGQLKNVLVYVKSGAEKWTYGTPSDPVELDQIGCLYSPHVIAVMPDQPIKIVNSDPFLHNIHPLPKNNPEFNLGQPVKGMETIKTFSNPEIVIPVKCDVHRWMSSYIAVIANPFHAVTPEDGSFQLKLPAGTFTIEAWHEKLGTQTQEVTVGDGESKEITFTFKAA